MKPRDDRSRSSRSKRTSARQAEGSPSSRPIPTPLKRWIFRLLPLAILVGGLVALEAGLRLAGIGYPPHFFLAATQHGEDRWIENLRFGWRFFPKQIARTPQPISFRRQKTPDTFRVFVLGESAALGDPKPAFGMPRILEILLQDALPQLRVEVVNVAMTAINSHVIREIADECATRDGDVWVIYAGNNEVIGPFGGGTVFGSQAPPRAAIAANLAWRGTRIGQLVGSYLNRASPVQDERTDWTGLEMFKDHQLTWEDPRLRRVHKHFQENLNAIVRRGLSSGARVVLSTVACNLRDCAPFGSSLPVATPPDRAQRWTAAFQQGTEAEAQGQMDLALGRYHEAEKLEPVHAELQFRIGRLLVAQGRVPDAQKHFAQARDYDVQRFRADSVENETIRGIAAQQADAKLGFVDAERRLAETSSDQLPGSDLFLEHVHFNFEGNYELARLLVPEVLKGAGNRNQSPAKPLLSLGECAERIGLTDWDRLQTLREIHGRMQGLPFSKQFNHSEQLARLQEKLNSLRPALDAAALQAAAVRVGEAITKRPGDWVLRDQHGKILQAAGNTEAALGEWKRTVELMPHYVNGPYQIGNLLDSTGRSREAEPYFRDALASMPHFVEAMNGLGLCLAGQQRHEEAEKWYGKALEWRPGFAAAHVNWGLSLAARQLPLEAVDHYEAALRLRPDNANTHYNLAVALKTLNRTNELLVQLRQAIGLNPQFREARYNLAAELARQGKLEEALAEYTETLKRWPQLADAHQGLANLFLQLQQPVRAAEEARAALRLNPNHAGAKSLLQQLESRPIR